MNVFEIESPTDWTSFKLIICKEKEEVTPLSLFNIQNVEEDWPALSTSTAVASKNKLLGTLAKVLMIYRLGSALQDQGDYISALTSRLEVLYRVHPFNMGNPVGLKLCMAWALDSTYRALAAAIDMFLNRFQSHPLSALRACTLPAFLRDCSTLTSIHSTARCLSIGVHELMEFAFMKELASDIDRIIGRSEHQEMRNPNSYFHYCRELMLIPRSPYSASANTSLFLWCHVIGCLQNKKRSINARYVECDSPNRIVVNAIVITYYLGHHVTAGRYFFREKGPGIEYMQSMLRVMDKTKSSGKVTVVKTLETYLESENEVKDNIKKFFAPAKIRLAKARPDSVGALVYQFL